MCHCVTELYYTMSHCVTGLYYDTQEILPCVSGDYRVNKANVVLSKFSGKEVEVRALIEGQFLAKRAYTEDLGFTLSKRSRASCFVMSLSATVTLSVLKLFSGSDAVHFGRQASQFQRVVPAFLH